jgi:hypothetical protein
MFIIGGNPVMGGLDTKVTFTASGATNTNQTTFSQGSVSFLTASPRRLGIVGFRCTNLTANLSAPSSCSIGGVGASLILQDPAGASSSHVQFWAAAIPSGTSGTVSVTRAANMTGQVFLFWVGENLKSFTNVGIRIGTFANPSTGSLTTQPPGIAVGMGFATSGGSFSWTGLTEDLDTALGTISYTAASQSKVSSNPLALSLSSGASCTVYGASWR